MKKLLLAACLTALPVLPALAQDVKLFSSSADVQKLIAEARAEHKPGNTVKIIAATPGYPVQLEFRSADTPPTVHPMQDELIEVIGGGCTFITGGKLVGVKPGAETGKTVAGTGIEGGTPRKVAKGDYIVVPAGTPHWYSAIQGELITVAVHYPKTN
jgi:mannose-6-phosphate isomerase-like protein (cupin superfamily)